MSIPTPSPELVEVPANSLLVPLIGVIGILLGAVIGAFLGALLQSRFARKTARHIHDLERQDQAAFQVADYISKVLEHIRRFREIYATPEGRRNSRIDAEVERSERDLAHIDDEIWPSRRLRIRDPRLLEAYTEVMSLRPPPRGDLSDASTVRAWEDWLQQLQAGLEGFLGEVERVTQQSA